MYIDINALSGILFLMLILFIGCYQYKVYILKRDLKSSKIIGADLAKKIAACEFIIDELEPRLKINHKPLDYLGICGRHLGDLDVQDRIDILNIKPAISNVDHAKYALLKAKTIDDEALKRLICNESNVPNDERMRLMDEREHTNELFVRAFVTYIQSVLNKEINKGDNQ